MFFCIQYLLLSMFVDVKPFNSVYVSWTAVYISPSRKFSCIWNIFVLAVIKSLAYSPVRRWLSFFYFSLCVSHRFLATQAIQLLYLSFVYDPKSNIEMSTAAYLQLSFATADETISATGSADTQMFVHNLISTISTHKYLNELLLNY